LEITKIPENNSSLTKNPGINPMLWMIITNLIPIIGVCFADWDTFHVIGLYWCESVMIGILNIPKILMAKKGKVDILNKIFIAGFSSIIFGAFLLGQGVFIFIVIAFTMHGKPDLNDLKYGAIAVVINSLISFYNNFVLTGQYNITDPDEEMTRPVRRIMGQQFFALGGLLLILAFDLGSKSVIILFIIIKILVEIRTSTVLKKELIRDQKI
jgi:hypothetical protein